jgi:hypothetical protein
MPCAECSSPTTKTKHERLPRAAPLARLQALDDLDVKPAFTAAAVLAR